MTGAQCLAVSVLLYAMMVAPCTFPDVEISSPGTQLVASSTVMAGDSSLTASQSMMTIAIINSYGTQLSLSFGLDSGYPSPIGNPQPTALPASSTTQYLFPTGWAGRVGVGPNLNVDASKIEGSFVIPQNAAVAIPDIDVSYVDGYTVPITCSSQGIAVTGYNIELFDLATCDDPVDGPVCLNPAQNIPYGPPPCFFCPLCWRCIHLSL
jgi:hypothetical protein